MLRQFFSVGAAVATAACSVVGVRAGTQEPHYDLVERIGEIQIRRYGERLVAETEVTGSDEQGRNDGFRRLAGYIFGANRKRAKIATTTAPVQQESEHIAMTAPVAQTAEGPGQWRIQFFMPDRYEKIEDLPTPDDHAVHLATIPATIYAVLEFSGARDGATMKEKQRELLADLANTKWRPEGDPVNWFYDPPWTIPMLRRNEVAVRVAKDPAG